MKKAVYEDILNYGRKLKEAYPDISNEDLKKSLLAHFIGGKDILQFATQGMIATPIVNYLALLSIVYNSLRKVITQDKTKLLDIQEKINRAVEFLSSIR